MTLTQAAILTKRSILVFIILIFLGITSWVGYNIWYQYYLSTIPPVEEKAENKFGQLPTLDFPPSSVSSANYAYAIDTETGALPPNPNFSKVYFIPRANITLLTAENAKNLAASLGFSDREETLSINERRYYDQNNNYLTMDLTTGSFSFQRGYNFRDLVADLATTSSQIQTLPEANQLINQFRAYLASKNLLPDQLKEGRGQVNYHNVKPEEARSAEVSLWPTNINDLPIVTTAFTSSLVRTILIGAEKEIDKFIKVDYTFWPVDLTTSSTYEVKTVQEAFDQLKNGQGFVNVEPATPQVSLTKIYLAYFQSANYSPYLQPVYVFEGPNFVGLVPAVKSLTAN